MIHRRPRPGARYPRVPGLATARKRPQAVAAFLELASPPLAATPPDRSDHHRLIDRRISDPATQPALERSAAGRASGFRAGPGAVRLGHGPAGGEALR